MRGRLSVAALPVLLVIPCAAVAQARLPGDALSRMAYFSPQRAFALSADGKVAQARLSALEAERTKELNARTARLNDLRDALRKNDAVPGEPARQQRELEIQRFEIDVKRFLEDAQAEFLGIRESLENAFSAKLRPAIAAVAKERGLLFLFNEDSGLLAWADPSLDITADIARRIDAP
jgi:Skp family chaperone for outer membrane proteins